MKMSRVSVQAGGGKSNAKSARQEGQEQTTGDKDDTFHQRKARGDHTGEATTQVRAPQRCLLYHRSCLVTYCVIIVS